MKRRIAMVTSVLASTSTAWAHPGHGSDGGSFSPLHYLTEPLHIGVGVLVLLGGVGVLAIVKKWRPLRHRP